MSNTKKVKSARALRLFATLLALCAACLALQIGALALAEAPPTQGAGTKEDPYRIGTAQTLYDFAQWYNSLDFGGSNLANVSVGEIYVRLTADIDLNPGFTFAKGGYTGNGTPVQWTPIGVSVTEPHAFWGVFDGNGHSISGVYINETSDTGATGATGLFRYVDSYNLTGTVKNLTIKNSYIGSKSHVTGSVAGVNCGTVENCKSSAFVRVDAQQGAVGGIGGVVGSNNNYWAVTKNCTFTGDVTASGAAPYVGGIVGQNFKGYVKRCANSGSVTASVDKVGGIVGSNIPLNTSDNDKKYGEKAFDGKVLDCVNTGSITGTDAVGGIVGYSEIWRTELVPGEIARCENSGRVTATDAKGPAGGIVGYCNDTDVTNCNNYANVGGGESSVRGGIVGAFHGKAIDACWYSQAENINSGLAIVGWKAENAQAPTNSGALSILEPPTDVTATPGDRQVALSWTAPSNSGGAEITGYKVAYNTVDTAPMQREDWVETGTADVQYTVTGLKNGVPYYFWVKAVNQQIDSAASASASATPVGAAAEVSIGDATTSYTSFADAWNAAVAGSSSTTATVKLLDNWTATMPSGSTTTSFGTGAGFGDGTAESTGYILVPSEKTIILDLNGQTIDRGLTSAVEYGNVITVSGNLTLKDTSAGKKGTITGGNNSDGGGVYVAGEDSAGGTFTMEGGSIAGNTAGIGGGVYVDGTFNVSGAAKVSGNTETMSGVSAACNVYLNAGKTITVVGELTGNASISVTTGVPLSAENPTVAITGESDKDYSQYFRSDGHNCVVINKKSGEAQVVSLSLAHTVTYQLTNLTSSNQDNAAYNEDYTTTLTPNSGYTLPGTVEVTVDGTALTAGTEYTYVGGVINLLGKKVDGAITITAAGVPYTPPAPPTAAYVVDEQGNRTAHESLAQALDAAKAGQGVEMNTDQAAGEVTVGSGVSLNLNGYDLTADKVTLAEGARLVIGDGQRVQVGDAPAQAGSHIAQWLHGGRHRSDEVADSQGLR
ncbi:MAG: fibronectin type III domain-containing protein, partial [Clostridia bacterium]